MSIDKTTGKTTSEESNKTPLLSAPADNNQQQQTTQKTVQPDPFLGAIAAGSAGGLVLGSFIGMPITGSIAGGAGCGYLAATRPVGDKLGDRVRAVGLRTSIFMITATEWAHKHKIMDRIQDTTSKAIEKAKLINEGHQVVEKAKDVTVKVVTSAKEFNETHQVVDKVSNLGSQAVDKAKELDSEYKIRDKTIGALSGMINMIEKSKTSDSKSNGSNPSNGSSQV